MPKTKFNALCKSSAFRIIAKGVRISVFCTNFTYSNRRSALKMMIRDRKKGVLCRAACESTDDLKILNKQKGEISFKNHALALPASHSIVFLRMSLKQSTDEIHLRNLWQPHEAADKSRWAIKRTQTSLPDDVELQ